MGDTDIEMSTWSSLTWDELEAWAGSRSVERGRAYQQQHRVDELVLGDDCQLLATVVGTRPYIVTVRMAEHSQGGIRLRSLCTCPVGDDGCKHAVATVLALLETLANRDQAPTAAPDDPRWDILREFASEDEDDEDDFGFDEFEDEPDMDEDRAWSRPTSHGRNRSSLDPQIREYLNSRSKEELVELASSWAQRFAELHAELRDRIALREGNVERLVTQVRRELDDATAIRPWSNSWTGEGETPDYGRLTQRLERLIVAGYADEVVLLGRELIDRGLEQVEQAHDEGDTAASLSACLPVVFNAVAQSSLTVPEKLLYCIDAQLKDDFDVIGAAVDVVIEGDHPCDEWSAVADELAARLDEMAQTESQYESPGEAFMRDYHRDQLSHWLCTALCRAERKDDLRPIYEREARATGSYERLVDFLIAEGEYESALQWAHEGIERTAQQYPGIAWKLAESQCEVARLRKQWPVVAAYAALQFFLRPGLDSLDALCAAARKARCVKAVRAAAMRFLETGCCPVEIATTEDSGSGENCTAVKVDESWPLPVPQAFTILMPKVQTAAGPRYDVLIDIAIEKNRPADVIRWFEKLREAVTARRADWAWRATGYADRVAAAVVQSHPEYALAMYEHAIKAHLKEAKRSAYEAIGASLRKMRPIYASLGRESDWKQRIADLREQYRRRPRFIDVLDTVENQQIVQEHRAK